MSIVSILSATTAFAQPVSLTVRSDRDRIYIGESFNLYIAVVGADADLPQPDLSALADADTAFLGSQSNSRRTLSIVNGNVRREETLGRTFVYQVKPLHEGDFATGTITLRHAGQTLSASGQPVAVIGITRQSVVIGRLTASTVAALVDAPFRITLSIAVAPLRPPYQKIEPLHINYPPRLEAAFLNLAEIKGLKQPDLRAILTERARNASGQTPSFLINDYSIDANDPFRFTREPQPLRFRFTPDREDRGGTNYWVYSLSLDYTPQTEGDYTFGPIIFKGAVITAINENNQPFSMKDVFAVAPAVTVRVTPPPEAGRPEWFVGTVGRNIAARARFDTDVCKVGDPLILTLEISGAISLSNLRPPLLALQEDLTRDFRIYDDNVTTTPIESGKRFTWRVRPIHAGTLEFPSIRIAYYDTDAHAYKTVLTPPIPIQARATTQVVSDAPDASADAGLFLRAEDLPVPAAATVTADPSPLLPPPSLLLPLLLAGPALLLCAVTGRFFWRRRGRMRQATRRHRAAVRARRRLPAAADPAAVAAALRGYLSERLDAAGHSLTPPEASRLLIANGVPSSQADAFRALLERLDEALYRPGAAGVASAKEAAALIAATEAALAGRRRAGHVSIMSILSIVSIISIVSLSAPVRASETSRTFGWEQANAQLAAARTPEAFLETARAYNRLVVAGDTRGALFYNMGTALLLAGDASDAILALDRAERRLGSTPGSRANLRLAYGLLEAMSAADAPPVRPHELASPAPLPWMHTAFFWHYEFPCRHRVGATAVGWALLCAGLLVRLFRPAVARPFVCAGLLLCVIFGASAAVTLLQEYRDLRSWPTRLLSIPGEEGAS